MATGPRPGVSPEGVAATLVFAGLIAVILVQVLGRTPLLAGPVWTEELARWLWVWMVFLGIGEVERNDGQLRMDLLGGALGAKARAALFTAIDLVYLAVAGHLVWIGWKTVARTWRNDSVTLPVPDGALYLAALVGMVLVVWRVARRIPGRSGRTGAGPLL